MSTEMVHSGSSRRQEEVSVPGNNNPAVSGNLDRRGSQPPDYEDVVHESEDTTGEVNLAFCDMSGSDVKVSRDSSSSLTEEEERMLSILKEVANKCCHANPAKRPTAEEVLKMLKSVESKGDKSKDSVTKKRY